MNLLADENIPWPLVKALRNRGIDVYWIPETRYRGISNSELIEITNIQNSILLTRDKDFLRTNLRRKSKHGIIYIGEPIKKENIDKLVTNILVALKLIKEKQVIIVTNATIEILRNVSSQKIL